MCGIFGYITKQKLNDDRIIESLKRRGPDANGIEKIACTQNKQLTLIHSRLSIIDISHSSNQPFWDETKRYCIVYNGELYNFKEIRKELKSQNIDFFTDSDTEVVLKAIIKWGTDALSKFRGMFAFAIYDVKKQLLIIARDIFGMKPLYYYSDNGNFVFSSLIKSILISGISNNFALDKDSINDYFATGSFIAPETILKNVKMLMPGHFAVISEQTIKIHEYFTPEIFFNQQYVNSEEQSNILVRETVIDAIEKHFIADVPVGVLLSGGIDSTIITSVASKILSKKVQTFTIGFTGKEYSKIDESFLAKKTALENNTIHQKLNIDINNFSDNIEDFIDAIDVPSFDGFNSFLISKKVSEHIKVVLSGLGGDEFFAGYPVFSDIYYSQNFYFKKWLNTNLRTILKHKTIPNEIFSKKKISDILLFKRLFHSASPLTLPKLKSKYIKNEQALISATIFEVYNYMSNTLLRDSDAVSMYNSLELRVPFVDKQIFSTICKIPDKQKINLKLNKPLLVNAFNDIIPDYIYNRKKTGFVLPIPQWAKEFILQNNLEKSIKNTVNGFAIPVATANSYPQYGSLILYLWLKKYDRFLKFD